MSEHLDSYTYIGLPRWLLFRGSLVLVSLLIVASAGCEKGAKQAFERPPAAVSVVSAVARDVPVYLDSVGKTVAREVVSIQPQVSGRITEIHFVDGADLKKGDLLFTIDPRPFKAQLDAAEATLAEKKAALRLAEIEFNRYADLRRTDSVSQQDYDQRKNTFEVAKAQVEQSQAAVDNARINLEYCFIRSPIDGRAGQRLVDIGNVVTANFGAFQGSTSSSSASASRGGSGGGIGSSFGSNATSLLTIQRLDPIYADFTIAENDLTAVKRNMQRDTLRVEVRLPDEADKPREGTLSFLDNAVQDISGTIKLRATIPNSDHHFWPGRFVKVRLVLDTLQGAVLIPADAAQMSAKGPFVYVVKEDSTAEMRPVKLGQRQDDLVVVEDGVKAGEQVVVSGQLAVQPGGKVRVEAPRPVGGPATAMKGDAS